jgi:23S rRNA (cytosine1962-C5)-methyltransferase
LEAIILNRGRERSVLQHHPWIFSRAVEMVVGNPVSGSTVQVFDSDKHLLGYAAYSPSSNIRARMWTWDQNETIDERFIVERLNQAFQYRKNLISKDETNSYRLCNAESDGLPGIIIDRYDETLVLQCLTAGAEYWKPTLVNGMHDLLDAKQIFERSDVDVRTLEGLEQKTGVLWGPPPPQEIVIEENGLNFKVDVWRGHKTGFYLDQRRNRQRFRTLVRGGKVLNCFAYTGAFTVYAFMGGVDSVLSVEGSAEFLGKGVENLRINHLEDKQADWLEGDVFKILRTLRDRGEKFQTIVLDPPKFAPTIAQAEKAARGYKDINLLALKLLEPGGLLFTFSCSGGISADLFEKIVAGAALDAGVQVRIVERLFQGVDHPVAINFPEGSYLKGLVCQVNH